MGIKIIIIFILGVGDLLIRIPYQEEWQGLFSVRIEAWHVQNPQTIPQLKKEKTSKYFFYFFKSFSILSRHLSGLKDL